MSLPAAAGPDLLSLFALFPERGDRPEFEIVPAQAVPPPYHDLLVHKHHMTVTVEAFYGDLANVRILDSVEQGDVYARKILLTLRHSGLVVQFGIVRVHLRWCSGPVRREILAGQTPLGRVLIQHKVLRRIEPTAYLKIAPGPALESWFGPRRSAATYGRLGYIHCDHQPAVELLEIMAPVAAPGEIPCSPTTE